MKKRAREEQDKVLSILGSLSASRILYCPNPGNAGDSAIATATYRLLEEADIQFRCVKWNQAFDSSGEVLVYGGGGSLTPGYTPAQHFLNRHHQSAERLIVLPHTIKGHRELLRQLGNNVTIFCREQRSYEWTCRHTDGPDVYKDDDLAFRLKPSNILERRKLSGLEAIRQIGIVSVQSILYRYAPSFTSWKSSVPLRRLVSMNKDLLTNVAKKRGNKLYAIRTDEEHSGKKVTSNNIDVSLKFKYGVSPPHLARRATVGMLSFIDRYNHIVTNRLHGCIMSAILGKKVDFYANSYYKNREVYDFSIKDLYPNVRWCGRWS